MPESVLSLHRLARWAPALYVLPALALLSAVTVGQNGASWAHEWGWAWLNWTSQTQIVGPVVGAVAAWNVADALRGDRGLWRGTGSRGRTSVLLRLAPPTAVAALVLLASGAIVLRRVWASRSAGLEWLAPSIGNAVAVIVICIGLGALIGRMWPHVAAPGVAAIGLWALAVGEASLWRLSDVLGVDGASTSLAGFEPTPTLTAARLGVAAAVTAVTVLAMDPRPFAVRSALQRLAPAASVVLLAWLLLVPGWFDSRADAEVDPAAVASACTARDSVSSSTVCLLPEHGWLTAEVARGLDAHDQVLAAVGLPAPHVYAEMTPAVYFGVDHDDVPSDTRPFVISSFTGPVALDVARSALMPAHCTRAPWSPTDLQRLYDAETVVTWVVAGRLPDGRAALDSADPAVAAFEVIPQVDQQQVLTRYVQGLSACDPARLQER